MQPVSNFNMVSRGGSMEEDPFCAPRLARDYFLDFDGWETPLQQINTAASNLQTQKHHGASTQKHHGASDPPEGQASSKAASDPHQDDGQASLAPAEINLQSSTIQASDPMHDGQASIQLASDLVFNDCKQAKTLQEGNTAVNLNLQFLTALCGIQIKSLQDITLLQQGIIQAQTFEAASNHARQAAPFTFSSSAAAPSSHEASSTPATLSSTTAPVSSLAPSANPTLTPAIPVLTNQAATPLSPFAATLEYALSPLPLRVATPSIYPHTIPAIPVLTSPAASPSSRWRDEVSKTSPATITSHSLGSPSQLRAMASPWKPGKPSLPSLLVGDIPLSPMLASSSTSSHSLLLPEARQSLAPIHSVENLGVRQPSCCPYCGQSPLYWVSPSTMTFSFSPLRGESMHQAQEVKALANRKAVAQLSSRPRWKMKGELKGFHILKANLDPG